MIVPAWISGTFIGVLVALIIYLNVLLIKGNVSFLKRRFLNISMVLWLLITAILAKKGFFLNFNAIPPHFILAITPPLIAAIAILIITPKQSLDSIPQSWLTAIHTLRLPVELCLWGLAAQHIIPDILTFHGRNFDIIIGLTAPLMISVAHVTQLRKGLLIWNIAGIGFLLNVVMHGILSAPTPFQVFHTSPPNTFIAAIPFIWLPSIIVPAILLCHALAIKKHLLSDK